MTAEACSAHRRAASAGYRQRRAALLQTYTEKLFELDLEKMAARFAGPYRTWVRYFRRGYWRACSRLGSVSHTGMMPRSAPDDVLSARDAPVGVTPKQIIWRKNKASLYRYERTTPPTQRTPVFLVLPRTSPRVSGLALVLTVLFAVLCVPAARDRHWVAVAGLGAVAILFAWIHKSHSVLGHRSRKLRTQDFRADLQWLRIAGEIEVQTHRAVLRKHALHLDEDARRRDVHAPA